MEHGKHTSTFLSSRFCCQTTFNCWACRQSKEVGLKVQPDRVVEISKGLSSTCFSKLVSLCARDLISMTLTHFRLLPLTVFKSPKSLNVVIDSSIPDTCWIGRCRMKLVKKVWFCFPRMAPRRFEWVAKFLHRRPSRASMRVDQPWEMHLNGKVKLPKWMRLTRWVGAWACGLRVALKHDYDDWPPCQLRSVLKLLIIYIYCIL